VIEGLLFDNQVTELMSGIAATFSIRMREWIKYWAKIVECKHVHIANEQKDRTKQAKPRLVVRGIVACTVTKSTLLIS
jgi:hypothetical protein